MKTRLDIAMQQRGLTESRSAAESWIRLGNVTVEGRVVTKPGHFVDENTTIKLMTNERYVSRAGLKLASVAGKFAVDFRGKTVLDVGSSTGGFSDYALQHGAARVVAVDVGTDQLHPRLRSDPRVEVHEKTDIRSVRLGRTESGVRSQESRKVQNVVIDTPQVVVIDVSFISLREILPHIATLMSHESVCLAMLKPQFEAGRQQINKGIIKNDAVRRAILRDFETWVRRYFVIVHKADSDVAGAHGNRERFYLLRHVG